MDLIDEKQLGTKLSQRALDKFLSIVGAEISKKWASYRNSLEKTFSIYIENKYTWCSIVRNIPNDLHTVPIEDIYVRNFVLNGESLSTEADVIRDLLERKDGQPTVPQGKLQLESHRRARAIFVQGRAGAGKSFLLRHIYIQICKSDIDRIPVLIELRNSNNIKLTDISNIIQKEFEDHGCSISLAQVHDGLENGLFAVLLDGFDELKWNIQSHYSIEIDKFSKKFGKCPILVTGRPQHEVYSWSHFEIMKMSPFDIDRVQELVSVQNIDDSIKDNFKTQLRESLFYTHREFLEIPLLVIVMLITFGEIGAISSKKHEFFDDVLGVLWRKHDARKNGFERQKYTGLELHDFRKLVATFSISSYLGQDFSFTDRKFREHYQAACGLAGLDVEFELFFKDMTISTCLIVEDGDYFKFIHRSFQEFFAAVYICECMNESPAEILDLVARRFETDNVIFIAHSIKRTLVENIWLLPILSEIEGIDDGSHRLVEYASKFGVVANSKSSRISLAVRIVRALYDLEPGDDLLRARWDALWSSKPQLIQAMNMQREMVGDWRVFSKDLSNILSKIEAMKQRVEQEAAAKLALLGKASRS
ncbi:NACHT domain-containing protein [Cucumibacter marinus]|uniref:NACHT domain-containing protein n=1 Tax=Cucumibacter marinus TaxID=1121252 RepID=UPI00041C99A9|nr:NACHT domain-containing protein [Cucumibacter marinus]